MPSPKTSQEIKKAVEQAKQRVALTPASKATVTKIRQNLKKIRSGSTPAEMSARIRDLCNENGYDPVYELMQLIKKGVRHVTQDSEGNDLVVYETLGAKEQIAIHKELIKYIYPTLKSVDVQGSLDANVTVEVKVYSSPAQGTPVPVTDAEFTDVSQALIANVQEQINNEVQN